MDRIERTALRSSLAFRASIAAMTLVAFEGTHWVLGSSLRLHVAGERTGG
jgi:hypothetical protein